MCFRHAFCALRVFLTVLLHAMFVRTAKTLASKFRRMYSRGPHKLELPLLCCVARSTSTASAEGALPHPAVRIHRPGVRRF